MEVKAGYLEVHGNVVLTLPYYPVGSIVMNTSKDYNPNTIYPYQTWELVAKGRNIIGVDENDTDFDVSEKIGGVKKHTLTIDEMPSHSHTTAVYIKGGNETADNLMLDGWGNSKQWEYSTKSLNRGGGKPHSIVQPFYTAYIWKRTA